MASRVVRLPLAQRRQLAEAMEDPELADAYRAIDALEPMPQRAPTLRPRRELFRWPLLVGIAALLLAVGLGRMRARAGGRA